MSRLTKLSNLLFGKSQGDKEIDSAINLIDQVLAEHRAAAKRHEQSLEHLKEELLRVETERNTPPHGTPVATAADSKTRSTRPSGRPESASGLDSATGSTG